MMIEAAALGAAWRQMTASKIPVVFMQHSSVHVYSDMLEDGKQRRECEYQRLA